MNIWIRRSLQVGTLSAGILLAGAAAAQAQTLEQHSGQTIAKAGIVNQAAELGSAGKDGTKNPADDTDPGIPAGAVPSGGNANNAQAPANEGRPAGVNANYSTTPQGQAQAPEAPAAQAAPTTQAAPQAPAAQAAPATDAAPAGGATAAQTAPAQTAPAQSEARSAVVAGAGAGDVVVVIADDDDDFGFIGRGFPHFRGGWDRWDRWDDCRGHRHDRWDCDDRSHRRHSCGRRFF